MSSIRSALVVLAAAAFPVGAHAQSGAGSGPAAESNLTVYGGYRFGGGFTDVNTGKTWETTDGPAYAVAADFPIDRRTQWEVFVSHRGTALKASGFSPVSSGIRKM